MKRTRPTAFFVLVLALGARLLLLQGPLDVPDWRQADTAYMALRMADEWPPDLLHPKAPYRGAQDVKAAEFPIYPALVSLVYRVVGGEHLPAARLVTLAFFAGALAYFFLAVRRWFGEDIALHAAAVYAVLPVGIPYSRMVHPDFCILFFAHAYLYHALDFLDRRRISAWLLATAAAVAVFLMKAPYGFYLALPLAVYAWLRPQRRIVADTFFLGAMLVLPLAAGLWFNAFRIGMESGFEESLLYPMKWTAESLNGRFFGDLAQRLDPSAWSGLVRRSAVLVTTVPGALLALVGLAAGWRGRDQTSYAVLLAWWAGAAAYLALVFPMVVSDHEYYSLPFLAPVALAAGVALAGFPGRTRVRDAVTVAVAYVLLLAGTAYGLQRGPYLRGPYFRHDTLRIAAARVMAEQLPAGDLVLSVAAGRSTGWSDPRILYMADRRGWSIEAKGLGSEELALYRRGGARWAAVVMTPEFSEGRAGLGPLAAWPRTEHVLTDPAGRTIGLLAIVDLGEPPADAPSP